MRIAERQGDDRDQGAAEVQQEEKQTSATTMISSMSLSLRVSIDRSMRSERS